jgi:hypothetical protein
MQKLFAELAGRSGNGNNNNNNNNANANESNSSLQSEETVPTNFQHCKLPVVAIFTEPEEYLAVTLQYIKYSPNKIS